MNKILMKITNSKFAQKKMLKLVNLIQYYMGIGSGSGVDSSGEKSVFDILKSKINQPITIFDVGANRGQYLNLILKGFKNFDMQIHSFEPSSFAFKELSKNNCKNVHLNNLALGKTEATMELYFDNPGSELASLTKRDLSHFSIDFGNKEIVKVTTLDSYCDENSIEKVNLLKIDVEGHELDVLAGGAKLFDKDRVDIVTFEFGGSNIDTKTFFRDYYNFLIKRNFDIFRITPTGYLFKIERYEEIHEQFRTTNYVAVNKRLEY